MARTAKRKRSSANASQDSSIDKHRQFASWAAARGVEICNVEPQELPGRGLGLVATGDIAEGSRILFVQASAMYKPDTSLLRQQGLEKASSQAKLALSALSHFSASNAKVALWRSTWPSEEDLKVSLPIFWPGALEKDLPGCIAAPLQRQLADYHKDWLSCKASVSKLGYDESQYRYHWMIVNSRSFHWAPLHGGSGYMVLCPFVDYINHGPTGSGCTVTQHGAGYEVVAQRSYKKGEEILASYGAHSNDKLFVHYGFMLSYEPGTPSVDDEIRIDEQVLGLLSDDVLQQLSDLGYRGPFALVPAIEADHAKGWELCFKTQVAVRASFLTCNEWEYFAQNGQDIGADSSHAVDQQLRSPFKALLRDCEAKLTAPDMLGSIRMRWKQIHDVVEWYVNHMKPA